MNKCIFLLVLGAALLLGAVPASKDEREPSPKAVAALSVTVVRPRQGSIAETISATGVTVPREELQVTAMLSGVKVREILVEVGASVKRNQKLAVLESDSLKNQVVQLKSAYECARDAFLRVDEIKDTGAVSKQLVREKRTDMQVAQAKLDDAELNLKRCTLYAPEAGVIFERNAVLGGLVNGSEPLFRIARHNEIELEAMVPESRLSALAVNQPVSVALAGEDSSIKGTIRLIAPRVDNAKRMAAIRIRLQSTHPIPVGLFATARIQQPGREGMLLPKTAMQQDGEGDFVWVLNAENKGERLPVNVILFGDAQVLVDTLPPDARVIARAGAFVKEGDHVRVVEN